MAEPPKEVQYWRLLRRARRTASSVLWRRVLPSGGRARRVLDCGTPEVVVGLFKGVAPGLGRAMVLQGRPNREGRPAGQASTGNRADSGEQQARGSSRMPPLQQAREIIASLRLEGTRFSVDDELLKRLERTRGLKVALETRKLSVGQGFTGAAVQIGDALVIVCPEGADALKDPIIAHEIAHVVKGDPAIDFEAVTRALNESPDLPFVICDPETELQAECTSAAIVVLARRPDSRFRRTLSKIGAVLFGRVPGSIQKWRDTNETHTRYFDVDR